MIDRDRARLIGALVAALGLAFLVTVAAVLDRMLNDPWVGSGGR